MSILEDINVRHADDLERLNQRIHSQLASSNTMMSRIVMSMLRNKGKQLRPLLLMICARIFGPVDQRVVASAAAVELLHNASLVHDDVVDNSMTRRGTPTVNAIWDNHIAVLVGDFFTSSAMQEAISTGDIRIVDALCKLGRQLSLGEIDQIYNAREHTLDIEGYYRIIDYKTASLFVSSAAMGCYAADAPDEARCILEEFALLFGRCFQIRDDIFDYFSSEQVGKPTGNDLREGKITLPLLHALEVAPEAERQEVLGMLADDSLSDARIADIQEFARRHGGIEYAYMEMERLRARAVEGLRQLPESEMRHELEALFDFVIFRTF